MIFSNKNNKNANIIRILNLYGFSQKDIIHGKLDQKNKQLEVDYAIGRDIRPEEIKKISATLKEWCDSCESVLQTIENQIDRANSAKAMRTKHTEDLETEVSGFSFIVLWPIF